MQKVKTDLTLKQQFRKNAVENKTAAFRVWKTRMRAIGNSTDPMDYIMVGYDNVKRK